MLGEKAAAHFYFLTQFGPTLHGVQKWNIGVKQVNNSYISAHGLGWD